MLRARPAALHPSRDPAGPTARSRTPWKPSAAGRAEWCPGGPERRPGELRSQHRAGGRARKRIANDLCQTRLDLRVSQTQTNKIINREKERGHTLRSFRSLRRWPWRRLILRYYTKQEAAQWPDT